MDEPFQTMSQDPRMGPALRARRRIKTGGGIKASLEPIPITKPVYACYREMLEARYPHLVV